VVHAFDRAEGLNRYPRLPPLVVGGDGALYGTLYSGTLGLGSAFRIDGAGDFRSVHSFSGGDGANPAAPLYLAPDGALYGTTLAGGSAGFGTVFRVDGGDAFRSLHSFSGLDGARPEAALVQGADGAFYGTTRGTYPSSSKFGSLFRIDAAGSFISLHSFDSSDGANPTAALVLAPDGALYGTTPGGDGESRYGTVFVIVGYAEGHLEYTTAVVQSA